MTVAAADIAKYSTYTVTEAGPFTETLFTDYVAKAGAILDWIDPGLDTSTYDWVHALLICHMYELKLGSIEMRSVSPGEWEFVQPGITGFWLQVQNILKLWKSSRAPQSNRGSARRADARSVFKLDKNRRVDPWREVQDA